MVEKNLPDLILGDPCTRRRSPQTDKQLSAILRGLSPSEGFVWPQTAESVTFGPYVPPMGPGDDSPFRAMEASRDAISLLIQA